MKTQHPSGHQYLKDLLYILLQRISGNFMNTKDRHDIDFIHFNVKCTNYYTHAHITTIAKLSFLEINICKPSLATIPKIMNNWL